MVGCSRTQARRRRRQRLKKSKLIVNNNEWKLLHNNIRGFDSKALSLNAIVKALDPSLIFLNETHLKNNRQLQLPGYYCFTRNRICEDGGGIATCVRENERLHTLKLTEGDDDLEMIVTRHSQFQTPINIINLYGAVKSRSTNEKINERWNRVREQVTRIEGSGELVVIIGDLNAHVGNMIEGNDMKVSHGGKLVKEFVESGHYTLLNATNKAKDGPFTRVDPGDVEKKSALDLCIISAELFPYVESLIIDKNKSFTPYRSMNKSVVKYSDHFSLLVVFKGLPLNRGAEKNQMEYKS